MLKIGQRNTLVVTEIFPLAYALNTPEQSLEAPVMLKESDRVFELEDEIEVFVYTQADGELLASLEMPKILMDEFATLTVMGASAHGYFFDWGLGSDLYAPETQVHTDLDIGSSYVVRLTTDKLGKLIGTTKIERFLESNGSSLQAKQAVSLRIYSKTPLGFKAIVDNKYQGLLFKSDLIAPLKIGQQIDGFIKFIRDDGKIDLSLQLVNKQTRLSLEDSIIEDLKAHDGMSTITDKSTPDEIFSYFKVSKAAYKKAIGGLYKAKKIRIEKNCIYLNT
ncbi:S1-like domain-containing RNA-binding protein [Glaciecola sp. 2405UD65-10]|uniref:S1-like domain-containing RNA-binding protein n=1 Tax=Glaciecola sp. 2405UD65-10 TaxID=3397244 RepID=UPI003B5AF30F